MYLTDKKNGIERVDDHEELEVLLESFSKQVEEIVNEAENIEASCMFCGFGIINNIFLEQRSIYTRNRGTNIRLQP